MSGVNATSDYAPSGTQRAQGDDPGSRVSAESSVGAAAEQVVSSVRALYERIDSTLHEQTATSPYTPLAIAAGVGFVLGGGIASPLGRVLMRLAARSFGPALLDAVLHDKNVANPGGSH
jgi:hypothetical protein